MRYYSENWNQATDKFVRCAARVGNVRWGVSSGTKFDIPYVLIGDGKHKVVINSGIHGIEGYFGSAAQTLFLERIAANLSPRTLKDYTIVLIHVINGWGMQNRMREVRDDFTGGLVDLNRNFGVDFSKPADLPQNPKYAIAHNLLVSCPDKVVKKNAIKAFRSAHLHDGVWDSISRGQYYEPFGLFYGGAAPTIENRMTMRIYDEIMQDADSLISIGLHTGLGRFYRKHRYATASLLVSHPDLHPNSKFFKDILSPHIPVQCDNNAVTQPTLLGDLVDCLETRYADKKVPIYTADFEIGTGEFPIMSPVYKRMDMGDARYDLMHCGKINQETWNNLTESWYPSDLGWRVSALCHAENLFFRLIAYMERGK